MYIIFVWRCLLISTWQCSARLKFVIDSGFRLMIGLIGLIVKGESLKVYTLYRFQVAQKPCLNNFENMGQGVRILPMITSYFFLTRKDSQASVWTTKANNTARISTLQTAENYVHFGRAIETSGLDRRDYYGIVQSLKAIPSRHRISRLKTKALLHRHRGGCSLPCLTVFLLLFTYSMFENYYVAGLRFRSKLSALLTG